MFITGLLFVALGFALVVLPGPLTIPPVLLGVWIWSTEFEWARRLLRPVLTRAKTALEQAKERPVASGLASAAGLAMVGAACWAAVHYELLARTRDAVGI